MTLQLGIVGLPNTGKSTLYNALTRAGAAVAPYPFTTIDPNVGVAVIRDPRLTALADIVQPERLIPATIEIVDIAGLVRGAHRGEGLGNQFLGHIRNVDAVLIVARCFDDPDTPHPYGRIDPLEDMEILELELALADLGTIERRLEKSRAAAKANPREFAAELHALENIKDVLQQGTPAIDWATSHDRLDLVGQWGLLTTKPRLLVANVSERDLPGGGPSAELVEKHAAARHTESIVICAQTEMDLADWPPDEANLYLQELGVVSRGLDQVTAAGYRLLGLITFFTITGGHEVRAWPIPRGTPAPAAAGRVHTDMERGFVRAEVLPLNDLLSAGSWVSARESGRVRVEGRSYLVQDGDVIHFRFAV
jgi:hypothetical protein